MARRLGPKHRLCRRLKERLCNTDKCPVARRPYPPGAHGPKQVRSKLTSFGIQLLEKQKAKYTYGLLERQFKNYVTSSMKKRGNTAELLLQSLERRIDNLVFRSGFTKTRAQARQLVTHGHFLVNNKKVNIPSYQVRAGDVVTIRSKSVTGEIFKNLPEKLDKYEVPSWLLLDKEKLSAKVLELPKTDDVQTMFDTKLIVEFYSR